SPGTSTPNLRAGYELEVPGCVTSGSGWRRLLPFQQKLITDVAGNLPPSGPRTLVPPPNLLWPVASAGGTETVGSFTVEVDHDFGQRRLVAARPWWPSGDLGP